MKILVSGRARTGKDALAKALSERFGLPILKTSTTRPRRWPGEDSYFFLSEEEAAAVPDTEKITRTTGLDGYERWASREAIAQAGVAVLDTYGFLPAIGIWKDAGAGPIMLVYAEAETALRRGGAAHAARKNGGDPQENLAIFDERSAAEDAQFSKLEALLDLAGAVSGSVLHPRPSARPLMVPSEDGWTACGTGQDGPAAGSVSVAGEDMIFRWRNGFSTDDIDDAADLIRFAFRKKD